MSPLAWIAVGSVAALAVVVAAALLIPTGSEPKDGAP